MPWGIPRTPWLQAQDHFVLITYACTVVGMVAVLTWERFLPTLLEARVLGFLPIRRGRLFLGKVLAMALFFGAFLIGSSLAAAVLIVMFANSHCVARHFATHVLAVGVAGYFTATSCLALLSLAALFPAGIRRIAGPLLQAALIAFLLLSLFFSPTVAPSLQPLVASQSRLLLWMPAFWFTGVYEFILHTSPVGRALAHLAAIAVAGTLISSASFLLLYPLAYRKGRQPCLKVKRRDQPSLIATSLCSPRFSSDIFRCPASVLPSTSSGRRSCACSASAPLPSSLRAPALHSPLRSWRSSAS